MLSIIKNELFIIDVCTILLVLIIAFLPVDFLRIILGIPVALFFPGYTLLAVMLPRRGTLDGLERIALSFGLSIVVLALIGYLLSFTPWGINLYPVVLSVTVLIILASFAAFFMQRRFSPEEHAGVFRGFHLSRWLGARRIEKGLVIGIILSVVLALGILGYAVGVRDVGEEFTEFYILNPAGDSIDYPDELLLGEEVRVVVGIVNHERKEMSYWVDVIFNGEKIEGFSLPVLTHEERWEGEYRLLPSGVGEDQRLEFLLYKDRQAEPTHRLYLWIDVH